MHGILPCVQSMMGTTTTTWVLSSPHTHFYVHFVRVPAAWESFLLLVVRPLVVIFSIAIIVPVFVPSPSHPGDYDDH